MTIIKIVKEVYDKLPKKFNLYDIIVGVKDYEEREYTIDSTIIKMLWVLRNDKEIHYKILNKRSGAYKKLTKKEQQINELRQILSNKKGFKLGIFEVGKNIITFTLVKKLKDSIKRIEKIILIKDIGKEINRLKTYDNGFNIDKI